MNDHEALKKEHAGFKSLPVVANIDNTVVNENYLKIKKDIAGLIETELERMLNTPELECLLVKTN
jgi:hypothetical protein